MSQSFLLCKSYKKIKISPYLNYLRGTTIFFISILNCRQTGKHFYCVGLFRTKCLLYILLTNCSINSIVLLGRPLPAQYTKLQPVHNQLACEITRYTAAGNLLNTSSTVQQRVSLCSRSAARSDRVHKLHASRSLRTGIINVQIHQRHLPRNKL